MTLAESVRNAAHVLEAAGFAPGILRRKSCADERVPAARDDGCQGHCPIALFH